MVVDAYPHKIESKLPDSEIEEKCLLGSTEDIEALRLKAVELFPAAKLKEAFYEESNFFQAITHEAWQKARGRIEAQFPGIIDANITFPEGAAIALRVR
jgi:hypothetical protein